MLLEKISIENTDKFSEKKKFTWKSENSKNFIVEKTNVPMQSMPKRLLVLVRNVSPVLGELIQIWSSPFN